METGYLGVQKQINAYKNKENAQVYRLANYLLVHKKINPMQALNELGIYRLGARISDLRHIYLWGIKTDTTQVKRKKNTIYTFITEGKQVPNHNENNQVNHEK